MQKFKNKYRIPSARLSSWDYSNNGYYYITICTKNRICYLGDIKDIPVSNKSKPKMKLSKIGEITRKYWLEIPEHFPFILLDEFIVMPNHFHGILIIDNPVETPKLDVSTGKKSKTENDGINPKWKPGTLGVIINQYKRICTINARKINPDFAWQSRFCDHIIRNEKSLYNIRNYIRMNPEKWKNDDYY
ncbi:MAG: transposase [Candidatus Cloacimonetes bacterium]|nr:transposase [Candidatus Cloacimonadota bacterium]MCF7869214.1 transposase [Candidatus Cloacimonadota bacterium]MCF7884637.1 transposase [Candidatus Cloacimonadota bacterium]